MAHTYDIPRVEGNPQKAATVSYPYFRATYQSVAHDKAPAHPETNRAPEEISLFLRGLPAISNEVMKADVRNLQKQLQEAEKHLPKWLARARED